MFKKHMNEGGFPGTWWKELGKNSLIIDTVAYKECGLRDKESGEIVYFPLPKTEEDLVTFIRLLELKNDPS